MLVKDSYRNIDEGSSKHLEKIFDEIYEEFVEVIGLSSKYIERLDTRVHIAKLKAQYLETGDRKLLNHINVAENSIKEEVEAAALKLREVVVHIEKMQGVRVKATEVTVAEFFEYIKVLKWQTR